MGKCRCALKCSVIISFVLVIAFFSIQGPSAKASGETYSETMRVGQTKTFYPKVSETVNSASWYSNDSAVEVVSQDGWSCEVKAVADTGTHRVILRCDYNYITYIGSFPHIGNGFCDYYITVQADAPTGVSISSAETVDVGNKKILTPVLTPGTSGTTYTWSSSNTAVATVSSNGTIEGIASGTCTVTVRTANGLTDSCAVTVKYPDLALQYSTPSNNAFNVSTETPITLTFNTELYSVVVLTKAKLINTTTNSTVSGTFKVSGKTLTFTPREALKLGYGYKLTVPANTLKNLDKKTLTREISVQFYTTPFSVVSTSPIRGAVDTSINADITINCSTTIQADINFNSIVLKCSTDNTIVSADVTISDRVLKISPKKPLNYKKEYTLTVPAAALKNMNNVSYQQNIILSFKTGGSRLTVSSAVPADESTDVVRDTPIEITFCDNILLNYDAIDLFTLKETSTGTLINGNISILGKVLRFVPKEKLQCGMKYKLTVGENTVFTHTGDYNELLALTFTVKESTLNITGTVPTSGAMFALRDGMITVSFNSVIHASDNYSNIKLLKGKNEVEGTVSVSGTTLVFQTKDKLEPSCTYTIDIPVNAVESEDKSTNAAYQVNFKTYFFEDGDGTQENPYMIKNTSQFSAMQGSGRNFNNEYIVLGSDILWNDVTNFDKWTFYNLSAYPRKQFYPIGGAQSLVNGNVDIYNAFCGTFDGRGHSIIGLYIDGAGLFNCTSYATIKNVNIEKAMVSGSFYTGGLIGAASASVISNCSISGVVEGNNTNAVAGGLIGQCRNSKIDNCYSTALTKATNSGWTSLNSSKKNIYSGGIVGEIIGNNNSLSNCYNAGEVNAINIFPGNCNKGGIYGRNAGSETSVANCFFLSTTAPSYSGGTALSIQNMQLQGSYTGFDFNNVWCINSAINKGFPVLRNSLSEITLIDYNLKNEAYNAIIAYYGELELINHKVFIAMYSDDGKCLCVRKIKCDKPVFSVTLPYNKQENVSTIKIYIWGKDKMMPTVVPVKFEVHN